MLLALLIWRLMERAMRRHVETTGTPLTGWDKKATERPTSCMMVTKFAGVIVLKHGHNRQLARPFSVVQQPYLIALDVPSACFTDDQSRSGEGDDSGTPLPAAKADPALIGRRLPADARQDHRARHQEMAARGWMIIGRSSGGKAASLRLTPEGQKWAA